jgi:hypothetical protein
MMRRERDEQDRRRREISEEYRHPQRLRPRTGHARERKTRGNRERQCDDHDRHADRAGIDQPLNELRVAEQDLEMVESGRIIEQKRIVRRVVQILRGFEGGQHHPVERKGGKRDEEHQDCGMTGASANPTRACDERRHLR